MIRRALPAAALALFCAALVPSAAHATLVYDKNVATDNPSVYVAEDDASSPKRIGAGRSPDLSPDGQTVVWVGPDFSHVKLMVSSTTAIAPRTLVSDYGTEGYPVAWAPDSKSLVAVTAKETQKQSLDIVDVANGTRTPVATGYFNTASFSPAGDQLIYAKSTTDNFKYDLFRYDLATKKTTKLTSGGVAQNPLWGPKTIVFTKLVDKSVRKYGPKGELYTMAPDGTAMKRLTNQKVGSLLFGLLATQFSDDGTRLLGQFTGQDTRYTQVVNPATGQVRTLGKAAENGYEALALSHDGKTVLAATGGFEPGPGHDIVTVPYAGGPAKILVKNSFSADWTR